MKLVPLAPEGQAHLVLSPDGRPDDELVDVIELVPILITGVHVPEEGLKLWPARDAHVQGLGSDEAVDIEQVEVVEIRAGRTAAGCPA